MDLPRRYDDRGENIVYWLCGCNSVDGCGFREDFDLAYSDAASISGHFVRRCVCRPPFRNGITDGHDRCRTGLQDSALLPASSRRRTLGTFACLFSGMDRVSDYLAVLLLLSWSSSSVVRRGVESTTIDGDCSWHLQWIGLRSRLDFDAMKRHGRTQPNQSPEPTRVLGTSAAEPPRVPSTRVAHL